MVVPVMLSCKLEWEERGGRQGRVQGSKMVQLEGEGGNNENQENRKLMKRIENSALFLLFKYIPFT